MDTQLVVRNNRNYPIRIIGINVVKHCGPPLRGTSVSAAGGAIERSVGLGFKLDSSDTDAEIARGLSPTEWQPHYFARYTVSIRPGAQQVFNIFAYTTKFACTFRYQATILDGDKKVYQLIGNRTAPFRVTIALSPGGPNRAPFPIFQPAYIGGAMNSGGAFVRVNPKTYRGF